MKEISIYGVAYPYRLLPSACRAFEKKTGLNLLTIDMTASKASLSDICEFIESCVQGIDLDQYDIKQIGEIFAGVISAADVGKKQMASPQLVSSTTPADSPTITASPPPNGAALSPQMAASQSTSNTPVSDEERQRILAGLSEELDIY